MDNVIAEMWGEFGAIWAEWLLSHDTDLLSDCESVEMGLRTGG